jgi:hypothetical protein
MRANLGAPHGQRWNRAAQTPALRFETVLTGGDGFQIDGTAGLLSLPRGAFASWPLLPGRNTSKNNLRRHCSRRM